MGGYISRFIFSRLCTSCYGNRMILIGLDNAGKTTILYKLKLGEVFETQPTIGFNIETISFKGIEFFVWDIGGQEKLIHLWKHYLQNTQGIIYVIDSNDRERIEESSKELKKILLEDELRDAVLLVLCNKQDIKGSMSVTEIKEKFKLDQSTLGERKFHIQPISAIKGDGLNEALSWLKLTLFSRE